MNGRLIRTSCDETGDYVVPNVFSPRDLVSRPDNMDGTVLSPCRIKISLSVPEFYGELKKIQT